MKQYKILIDASMDVDQETIEGNDIGLVPMTYTRNDVEVILDHIPSDEESKIFYDDMRSGVIMKTTQVTPFYYEKMFRDEASKGNDILYIALSSGLSGTYESAKVASQLTRKEHPEAKIEVVDSLGGTGGMGLLMRAAIRNRASDMSLQENAACLRELAPKICYWFMVDDLIYLKRGGRISAATAFAGNMLQLHPILKIDNDGKLVAFAKEHGIRKTLKKLVSLYDEARNDNNEVILIHADALDNCNILKNSILAANPSANITTCSLSPIVGAHTGPGMLALIHYGNRNIQ